MQSSTHLVRVEIDNPDVVEFTKAHAFVREKTSGHTDDERRWNQ